MRFVENTLRLSPTDLAYYAACDHLTSLDLQLARGEIARPDDFCLVTEALRRRGEEHERKYVEHLKTQGLSFADLRDARTDANGAEATLRAMQMGIERIVQAPLVHERWAGRADVLVRVDRPSALGGWSYEPLDTKLARDTRGSAILQLCAYAFVLEVLQGAAPEHIHVVAPGQPFQTSTYRLAEYAAYYRSIRRTLEERVDTDAPPDTYPDPVAHCDICRWTFHCDAQRRSDDHLSLVANIRSGHIRQFQEWSIHTVSALAGAPIPFPEKPARGSVETLVKAREQARIQVEGRNAGKHVFECLPVVENVGFCRLPEPSAGDIFLDLEGDPFVPDAGREFLFGFAFRSESGDLEYRHRWALTEGAEKKAFEEFVDFVTERRQRYADLHIYHYAPYEPSALKRLMGRFGTREDEIDRLLRGDVFVDLYAVVRQAIRASVERYSIKALEPLYAFVREMPLAEAGTHLRTMEMALEFNEREGIPEETLEAVRRYNKDDCVSAARLRDWLEGRRADLVAAGQYIPRPVAPGDEPGEQLSERVARVRALMDRLCADVPDEPSARSQEQQACWLLAQLLEFHRREDKATWWNFFRLAELPTEDFRDEPDAIADLRFVDRVGGTEKCPIDRYTYPPQEVKHPEGEVHAGPDAKVGSVEACDLEARTIDIKKMARCADLHPTHIFFFKRVSPEPIPEALFQIGESVVADGIDGNGPYEVVRELVLNRPPRLVPGTAWEAPGEGIVDRGVRLVRHLDRSVLPVQGPPGAGKTFLGAHMICALVREGRRIGVTATSHKVIRNLLDTVGEVAREQRLDVRCIHKVPEADEEDGPIQETTTNDGVLEALAAGEAQVAGGTVWLWSRGDSIGALDVLFVDEAGQMSLANVVAAGRAARSIVLLGDPQQLEQPLQGSHPEGTAASVLHHVLGGAKTMPPDRGLFLPETWRLAPSIAAFTSELFYEGRLSSRPGLDVQRLVSPAGFNGSGLWFVRIEHVANQNESPEEAAAVAGLVRRLIDGHHWVNQKGEQAPLGLNDILIVAPYNAQVGAIQELLPRARVGTVDRFQGQEAAVVIYSLTTSSPEDAPRGMEFLYSLNRLNVATSRARCAVFLICSPRLLEPDCRTPRQMQLANGVCRYVEVGSVKEAAPR